MNSLFEDNAEYGFGSVCGQSAGSLLIKSERLPKGYGEFKEICENWLDGMDDADASRQYGDKLLAIAKECAGCGCECDDECAYIVENSDMLTKKSIWIFGGDGWAYDIGFGGLDHVLASGEDINVFVFDTEVYSNTEVRRQRPPKWGSCAVCRFGQGAGKEGPCRNRDVIRICMSPRSASARTRTRQSRRYRKPRAIGPSLVIGYAPCEMHGIKGGMSNSQLEIAARGRGLLAPVQI